MYIMTFRYTKLYTYVQSRSCSTPRRGYFFSLVRLLCGRRRKSVIISDIIPTSRTHSHPEDERETKSSGYRSSNSIMLPGRVPSSR